MKPIEISKTYPRQVNIKITEKQGVFCAEKDGQYYIFSDTGVLLEENDNIEDIVDSAKPDKKQQKRKKKRIVMF